MKKDLPAISEELNSFAQSAIAKMGIQGEIRLFQLKGGKNNRVFRVDINESSFLLKAYFQHKDDPRDRLRAEYLFSTYAWESGLRSLPRPIASDPANHLGMYEFVQGRRLNAIEISSEMVRQALNFFLELNCHKHSTSARQLQNGSEACFSISDHLLCIEKRLQGLKKIEDSSSINRDAINFVSHELTDFWTSLSKNICKHLENHKLSLDCAIPFTDRCLSPSDFGFHNAILTNNGQLKFIDFEYAGWDDPAKMVCDFFCQPEIPVPAQFYDLFSLGVASKYQSPQQWLDRTRLLLPVYRIKWCCILLNDFLPLGRQRRDFAEKCLDPQEAKSHQLTKARKAFEQLADKESIYGLR